MANVRFFETGFALWILIPRCVVRRIDLHFPLSLRTVGTRRSAEAGSARPSTFLVALFLVLAILMSLTSKRMSAFLKLRFRFAAVILSAECILLSGAESNEASPFLPPDSGGKAAPAAPAPTLANLQFASVLSFGREILISVYNVQTNEGVWIPVGDEAEGIRVITYDPDNEEVTVLSAGVTARLKLREASFASGGLIRPLPTLEQEYGRPLTVEEQETEARMLVSDLLEIGMKERERQRELRRQDIKHMRTRKK